MYNAGSAIKGLRYQRSLELVRVVRMEVKGCERFGAYSMVKPRRSIVEADEVDFQYGFSI